MKKNQEKQFNTVLLVTTLIVSAVAAVGLYCVYRCVVQNMDPRYMPLFVGGVFAIYLAVICLTVLLVSNVQLTFRADVITGNYNRGRSLVYILAGAVLAFGLMAGAEYLYEQNFTIGGKKETKTYVFLIDDSGTMEDNDPADQRYDVLEQILSQEPGDTRFAVYSFATEVTNPVPMQTVAQGIPAVQHASFGRTYMGTALTRVLDDYASGLWTSDGKTDLILITDGLPSDFASLNDVKPLLDQCVNNQITLGIVGVIGADNQLMEQMAGYTGGTFVDINDASMIGQAVSTVLGGGKTHRDLFCERRDVSADWLYGIIRGVAFALMGILLCLVASMCYGNSAAFGFMMRVNSVKAVLVGIAMELVFLIPSIGFVLFPAVWSLMGTMFAKYGNKRSTFEEEPKFIGLDFD